MGNRTLVISTQAAILALAWSGIQAAETGTAVAINPDPDAGAKDGEMTFFGVKATKDEPTPEEERQRYEQSEADPYVPPQYANCPFDADRLSLSDSQRALLLDLLRAVAANFPYGAERVPSYQKQMALALAMRLDSDNTAVKLTDYQLRRLREPATVTGHKDRATVAAKLWNAGFGLHRFSERQDDRLLAFCLLDLARHFDPANERKIAASEAIGHPAALTKRWANVTTVPPFAEPRPQVAVQTREPEPPTSAEMPRPEPKAISFVTREGAIALLQPTGGAVRLSLRATPLREVGKDEKKSGLQASLRAEPSGGYLSQTADNSVRDAVAVIDRELPDWRKTGDFLSFALESTATREAERSAGVGAAVLARTLAAGATIDEHLALAATLGADGTLKSHPDFAGLLADASFKGIVAVAPAQKCELLDLAILGNLEPLLHSQFVAFDTVTDLSAFAATAGRSVSTVCALELFAELVPLAQRMSPEQLVANPHVQTRLRSILLAIPGHLSAAVLLEAGEGKLPATLTLASSLRQLQEIEAPIRQFLELRTYVSSEKEEDEDAPRREKPSLNTVTAAFADCEHRLRHLRPKLHTETQAYALRMFQIMDDTLLCFRSESTAAHRKAVAMLESMTPELADSGDQTEEP